VLIVKKRKIFFFTRKFYVFFVISFIKKALVYFKKCLDVLYLGIKINLFNIYRRYLLAYSSVGHLGWILAGCLLSINLVVIYYTIYSIISACIIFFIIKIDFNYILLEGIFLKSISIFIIFLLLIFSLRGIPPFLGFLLKWIIVDVLIANNLFFICVFILLGSLFNIYYYLKIVFNLVLRGFNIRCANNFLKYYGKVYYYVISYFIFIGSLSLSFIYIFIL